MHPDLSSFLNAKTSFGLSPHSITSYSKTLRWYYQWLDAHALDAKQPESVEAFLTSMRLRKLSAFTISGCFRVLSVYFKWMVKRGKLDVSPMTVLFAPKLPRQRKKHVTVSQFNQLYDSIGGISWRDYRDRAIFQILFYSGLRAGELVSLTCQSIDRIHQLILVTGGKGDKDRDVPYAPPMVAQLDMYLSLRPPTTTDALFVAGTTNAKSTAPGALSFGGLTQIMRRRCAAAGLHRLGLHSFRHGFAMLFLNEGGMELDAISKAMGHSTTALTRKFYADYDTDSLRKRYNNALERMKHEG